MSLLVAFGPRLKFEFDTQLVEIVDKGNDTLTDEMKNFVECTSEVFQVLNRDLVTVLNILCNVPKRPLEVFTCVED